MIGAANDVGQAHVEIVGDDAEVVSGNAIRSQQHEIFEFFVSKLHAAKHGVVEPRRSTFGNGKSQRGRLPSIAALLRLFGAQLAAAAVVHRWPACSRRFGAPLFQFFFGAEAGIRVAAREQLGSRRSVKIEAL